MPRPFVVPEGKELEVAQLLAGDIKETAPACPMCKGSAVCRVLMHRLNREMVRFVRVAHLWYQPCTDRYFPFAVMEDLPHPSPNVKVSGGGLMWVWTDIGLRCSSCGSGGDAKYFWPR